MKRSKKRIFSSTAVIAAICMLTSCSLFMSELSITGDTTASVLTAAPYTKESVTSVSGEHYIPATGIDPKTALAQLADADGEGDIFLIATVTGEGVGENPIWQSEGRLTYNSSVERINNVAEKYDLKIASYKLAYDELAPTLAENIKNYAYTADLLVVPASLAEDLIEDGLVLNLSQTAFFDKTAYYFDGEVIDLYNDGDVFCVCGDAMDDPASMLCVYYNSEKVGQLTDTVNDGEWTLERLVTLGAEYGVSSVCSLEYLIPSILGVPYGDLFDKDGDLKKQKGDVAERIESVKSALGDKFAHGGDLSSFISGECVFYIGCMSDAASLSKMSDRWSIAPLPAAEKAENEPSYPTVYAQNGEKWLFLVPEQAAISERSVLVMSGLCAATCDEAKIEIRTEVTKYLRSNDAKVMLDLVLGIGKRR